MAEVKLESGMSKLYELKTEFERSIENINTLKTQYDALSDIVEKSGRKDELPEGFVDSFVEYKQNLDNQLVTINNRLNYLSTLIGWYEKQDDMAKIVDNVVTLTLTALGIFNNDFEEEKAE